MIIITDVISFSENGG